MEHWKWGGQKFLCQGPRNVESTFKENITMIGGREKKRMPTEKSRQICLHRQELEHERVLCPTRNSSFFFSHAIHCSLSIFTIGCSLISHLVQHNTALAHMYNNPAQHCVMYSMQSPKESKNTSEEDPAPKLVFEEEKKKKDSVGLSWEAQTKMLALSLPC